MQLGDSWRLLHLHELSYTLYSHPHKVYSQIDYILLQHVMLNYLANSSIGNNLRYIPTTPLSIVTFTYQIPLISHLPGDLMKSFSLIL